jgi:hypothetical protein
MTKDDAPKAPPFDWGNSGDDTQEDDHHSEAPDAEEQTDDSFGLDEYSGDDEDSSPMYDAIREREAREELEKAHEDAEETDEERNSASDSPPVNTDDGSELFEDEVGEEAGDDEFIPSPDGPRRPRRKINIRRVGAVAAVVVVVGIVIAAVVFAGLPSLPSVGACDAGDPQATFATFQHAGQNGESVAFQLTDSTDVQYVHLVTDETVIGNVTARGSVVTANALSSGSTVEYVGYHACGSDTLGTYTVR